MIVYIYMYIYTNAIHAYIMEYYDDIKMKSWSLCHLKLQGIMLSKISQKETISVDLTCGI